MIVPIPPIDAAYAIPRSRHRVNLLSAARRPRLSALPAAPPSFLSRVITLSAMGSIMMVVAVFDTHMLSAAVVSMKPPTN